MSIVASSVPLVLAATLAVGTPARGADPPAEDPVLAGLLEEARAENPDVRAAGAGLRAARQRPAQAAALADPVLSLVYTNDGWSPSLGSMPDANLALMVTQELPFPGKRRLRGRLAALEAGQVEQQLERARLTAEASVRRAYHGLLESRALADLAREQTELWRQVEGVARARYSVGQGNQQDVLRTQVELTRTGQALAEQDAAAAIRVAEINGLVGRPAQTPLPTTAAVQGVGAAAPLAVELERLRARSPELAAAYLAVERSRAALDLARREFKPDFAMQGGYMNRGGLDPMWLAGISVTVPLNRKRRAAGVAEAEERLRAAESRLRSVELLLRLRTEQRLAQLGAAQDVALLYREGIVPQDRMSVEAAVSAYTAGRLPFVAVLESLITLQGDRATLVRLLAGQSMVRASLDEASLEATSDLPALTASTDMGTAPAFGAAAGSMGGAMGMSR
jgi:outer membrane protein TolC